MTEAAEGAPDALESDVDAAIAWCDGDLRAALRAVYGQFPERELETVRTLVSAGYTRGQISPARRNQKLDDPLEISSGPIHPEKSSRMGKRLQPAALVC
jgi:hypothetical protein